MNAPSPAPQLAGLSFIQQIGSGGFAEVFLYERHQPRLKVAVKVMRSDLLDDVQRAQFVAEADLMAELAEHPYIVPVLGAGEAPDGRPYLVMRYFPPPDMAVRVSAAPLSVQESLRTGIQLASAVETAHRAGIIHRDIKPSNVLMSTYGVPALSDFGIAGRGDRVQDDDSVGVSVPWSAPEILTSESNGSWTSDVYSLGATIWNLLVGRSPFSIRGGDNSYAGLFSRIMHNDAPVTGRADVPASLDRLLQQTMARNPAHRPQTAIELARHLQRVEQELRFARTDILVLDNAGTGVPTADPGHAGAQEAVTMPGAGRNAAPEDPDLEPPTSLRTPTRISPDAPGGSGPFRARDRISPTPWPAPEAPGITWGTSDPAGGDTSLRSDGSGSSDQSHPGQTGHPAGPVPAAAAGPRAPIGPLDRSARRETSPTGGPSGSGGSGAPGGPDPGQSVAPSPDEPAERTARWPIPLAIAVLVVAVVGGMFLFLGDAEKTPDDALPPAPNPTGPGDIVDVDAPSAPAVEGTVEGDVAVFTWQAEAPEDTFAWNLWDAPNDVRKAEGTRIEVPLDGDEVCIRVLVRRGAQGAASSKTCAG